MNLGGRLALVLALVAALVASMVGFLSYEAASLRVMREVDRSLEVAATALAGGERAVLAYPVVDLTPPRRPIPPGEETNLSAQLIAPDGTVTRLGGRDVTLPVDDADRALAPPTARGQAHVDEIVLDGENYRVLTTGLGDARGALQVAVDIDGSRNVLDGLAAEVLTAGLAVSMVAAVMGWLLSRRITRPLAQLADAAERVATAGPGVTTVPEARGHDEVARLSTSFRTMLARLCEARETQERLVQDAAHELRTPLTSLRTNARVLRRLDDLPPSSREKLVADIEGETRELSELVDELVALALTRRTEEPEEELDLPELVGRVADRISRRTGREVVFPVDEVGVDGAGTDRERADGAGAGVGGAGDLVRGRRAALERAVGNLIENAAKFDAAGTEPIEVEVRSGTVAVSDRGPGIPDELTERIFDRFFRCEEARSLTGSGLGLAIVRDVAESHDGVVFAQPRSGGGARVGFTVGRVRLLPSSHLRHDDASRSPTTLEASSGTS